MQLAQVAQEEQAHLDWRATLHEEGHQFAGGGRLTGDRGCWIEDGEITLKVKPARNPGASNPVVLNAYLRGTSGPGCQVIGDERRNYPTWGTFDPETGQVMFATCGEDGKDTATGFIHSLQKMTSGEFSCHAVDEGISYRVSFQLNYSEE